MKIYDIISETQVQEGPAIDLLKLAGRGIASGAKWIAQTGSRRDLVDIMSKNSQIIRDTLRGTAPTAAQVEAIYGPRAGQMFANDPNFMAKVLKKFHADRAIKKSPPPPPPSKNSPLDPNAPPVPSALRATLGSTMRISIKVVSYIASVYGLVDAVTDYNKGVAFFDEQLKKGEIDPTKYKAGVAHLRSTLVAQIAGSVVLWPLLREVTGWGKFVRWLSDRPNKKLQGIGRSLAALNPAARAALILALTSKEARLIWSDMFAGSFADQITDDTWNEVTNMIKTVTNSVKKTTGIGTPDETAPTDKDATSANPTTSTSTPTTPTTNAPPAGSSYKENPLFKGIKG